MSWISETAVFAWSLLVSTSDPGAPEPVPQVPRSRGRLQKFWLSNNLFTRDCAPAASPDQCFRRHCPDPPFNTAIGKGGLVNINTNNHQNCRLGYILRRKSHTSYYVYCACAVLLWQILDTSLVSCPDPPRPERGLGTRLVRAIGVFLGQLPVDDV